MGARPPRSEARDADEDQEAARCCCTGPKRSAQTMSKSMSDSGCPEQEGNGTDLRSVGQFTFEQRGSWFHWEHEQTGLHVEMHKKMGMNDGYGNYEKGYTALARTADGEAVDQICGNPMGGYLPNKADAWKAVRQWMKERSDGQLRGDEGVRF